MFYKKKRHTHTKVVRPTPRRRSRIKSTGAFRAHILILNHHTLAVAVAVVAARSLVSSPRASPRPRPRARPPSSSRAFIVGIARHRPRFVLVRALSIASPHRQRHDVFAPHARPRVRPERASQRLHRERSLARVHAREPRVRARLAIAHERDVALASDEIVPDGERAQLEKDATRRERVGVVGVGVGGGGGARARRTPATRRRRGSVVGGDSRARRGVRTRRRGARARSRKSAPRD